MVKARQPSRQERDKLNGILKELYQTLKKGVTLSEEEDFTSHRRIFLHLISHIQTLQDSLDVEEA